MSPALPRAAAVSDVTMTSTLSRTNSAAISAKRSLRPSAQRYSIATVRPSIQPSSRSRCTKAAVHGPQAEAVPVPREPDGRQLRRLLRARRERPPAAAPPSSVMNSRRSHSITSSARASSVGGTSRPSAFAVLRLMTSSNLVDCTTGRSAGFSPLRIGRCRRRPDDTHPRGWLRSSSARRHRQMSRDWKDRGDRMARRQVDQLDTPADKKWIGTDEKRVGPLARQALRRPRRSRGWCWR